MKFHHKYLCTKHSYGILYGKSYEVIEGNSQRVQNILVQYSVSARYTNIVCDQEMAMTILNFSGPQIFRQFPAKQNLIITFEL